LSHFFSIFQLQIYNKKLVKTSGENVQGEMSEFGFGFLRINKENIYYNKGEGRKYRSGGSKKEDGEDDFNV